MAISPPGDIVLDVARAADPAAVEAARTRLAAHAGRTAGSFEASLSDRSGPASAPSSMPAAFERFEAMVLQTFLQSMLPEDATSVYGEGMAGEMWQSMLAEQLGSVMARRGGIGIADRMLRDHYIEGEKKVPLQGVSHDPQRAETDSREMLSVALVQEIQRKMAQSLGDDRAEASTAISSR